MRICLEASVERGDCWVIGMAPINLDIDAKFMNLIAGMTSSVRQRLQGQSQLWDELRGMKSKLEGLEDLIADQPPWPDLD